MFFTISAILFPIFAIVGAGYWYGRRHHPDMSTVNRLNMDVFVPILVFFVMAGKEVRLSQYAYLALSALILLILLGVLSYALVVLAGRYYPNARLQTKTIVPPMVFNNSGNIGLPLALLTWGEAAIPAAVILFMVENTLHFSLGAKWLDTKARLLTLWKVPVVLASIAGVLVAALHVPVWSPLMKSFEMVGNIAIPLLLFGLGVRMNTVRFEKAQVAIISAIIRPIAGMLLAWGLAKVVDLPNEQAVMLIVYGALPPALLNYLFAERYHQEPEKVASIVLIGNLLAVVFLPLALWLVLPR